MTYVFDIDSDLMCLTVVEHSNIIQFEYIKNDIQSEFYEIELSEDRFKELSNLLEKYNILTDLEMLEVVSIILGSEN